MGYRDRPAALRLGRNPKPSLCNIDHIIFAAPGLTVSSEQGKEAEKSTIICGTNTYAPGSSASKAGRQPASKSRRDGPPLLNIRLPQQYRPQGDFQKPGVDPIAIRFCENLLRNLALGRAPLALSCFRAMLMYPPFRHSNITVLAEPRQPSQIQSTRGFQAPTSTRSRCRPWRSREGSER